MVLWTAWNLAILVRLRSAPAMAAAFAAILILAIQTDVIGDPWVAYVVWGLAGALSAGPARLLASGARKTAGRDAK